MDVATLTGACLIALGEEIAGFWTDDEAMSDAIIKAAGETGEPVWRMPLHKSYERYLKSDFADTSNIGKKEGGAVSAALFLNKFVGETPWMHLDIAGPFWSPENKAYIPKGSTGYGPRLLVNFLRNWVASDQG
jgi:leucyl aminopeptidase